jgi:hypothetical protein
LGDRLVPAVLAVAMFGGLWWTALATASGPTATGALAPTVQGVWLIGEGLDPVVTVDGFGHLVGTGLALVSYPVAWLATVLPTTATLLALQSGALALGVVPLWLVARRDASLRVGASTVLVGAYALYPAVHEMNLAGFHPAVLALPALVWAAHCGLVGHRWGFWVAAAVAVACRADLGVAVAGLGLSLWLVGRRPLGRAAMVAGVAWAVVAGVVVGPWLAGPDAGPRPLAGYGDNAAEVVTGLLTDPGRWLVAVGEQSTIELALIMLGPVLFLPFLAPRLLVGVVPVQAVYLIGEHRPGALLAELAVPLTALVFVSSAFALSRLGRPGTERVRVDPRLLVAVAVAAVTFFVVDAPDSPYRQPWQWGATELVQARTAAVGGIDPGKAVRASSSVLDAVAERQVVHRLADTPGPDARDAAAVASDGVDVVVVDSDVLDRWTAVERLGFTNTLVARGFVVVDQMGGVPTEPARLVVFERPQ